MRDEDALKRVIRDSSDGMYTICRMSGGGYTVLEGQIAIARFSATTLDEAFQFIRAAILRDGE